MPSIIWESVLVTQGKLDEATAYFQKALQNQPDDPNIRNNLGMALAKVDDDYANTLVRWDGTTRPLFELRKALEIYPDFADARHSLAVILLQKGQVDEAIAQFQTDPGTIP